MKASYIQGILLDTIGLIEELGLAQEVQNLGRKWDITNDAA